MSVCPATLAITDDEGERPGDFTARFDRDRPIARGAGVHLKRRWTLAAGALAIIALPAFAAQGDWDRFSIGDAVEQKPAVDPMPFEKAGDSFPGSAFYYLQLEQAAPQIGEGIHSDAEPAPGETVISPPAKPIHVDNSGVDRSRAEECLAAAVYYEAASEPDAGQRAVAQVVLNRMAHPAYPKTVCGVVYQGSERGTGCQFSFTCDGSLARRPIKLFWDRARSVARAALAGYVYAPVGLATHYHTVQVHPYWSDSLAYLGTIGAHRFYALNGAAGRPTAFRFAYFGHEPAPGPNARLNADAAPATDLDPLAIERTYAAMEKARSGGGPSAADAAIPAAARPAYASSIADRGGDSLYQARNLPEAQGIKPEFARSGSWIAGNGPSGAGPATH